MGLLGWIKKEIESTSRQRRQSAPPPIAISLSSPNQHRDEAYMRAISKFNEWRNNQRFERLNETKNVSGITQVPPVDQSAVTDDYSMISDVVIDVDEKRRLIQMHRDRKKQEANRRLEHKVTFQQKPLNHRLSLPIMRENPEKVSRRKNRKSQVHPSTTIDEIEEFEQNHCVQMDEDYSLTVASPPSKFYHDNSEPYTLDHSNHTPEKKLPTPKKQSLMGRNMLRRAKSNGKARAPQPPVIQSDSSSLNFYNGSYKHYHVASSSAYEEYLAASKAYSLRNDEPEKINSVGESASSGSLSSEPEKNLKKQRRLSPPYQTVINKHGDEVEYALPYNERDSLANLPPLPTSLPPEPAKMPQSKFEQIINENFQFLNSNLEYFNADDDSVVNGDAVLEPIETSFSDMRRKNNLQVTDLDKSNDTALGQAQSGDIMKDLDALSKWAGNLQNCERKFDYKSPIKEYLAIQANTRVIGAHELKYKSGILRNSFSTPLEFSNGYFSRTPITLRSTLPNIYNINSFADSASKHEFEILSQIKHQNVAILMGISHDDDLRVMSLVMEPFDYTLNHYLHQMDQYFSIQQTISIVMQIAGATQYLHERGFIHSNISSHAVLVRENPFAVKLSSFELTTEILPRASIGKIFHPKFIGEDERSLIMTVPAETSTAEKYFKLSKQHFYNRTSLSSFKASSLEGENDYRLPYTSVYRRMFAMHYYQAPELLIPSIEGNIKNVLPSTRSDTFSLALLLWETLNHCVPFVVYNLEELILAYKTNDAKLPLLDKTSSCFMDIFDSCLRINSDERMSDVLEFISMLDEIRSAGEGKKKHIVNHHNPVVPIYSHSNMEKKKNFKNAKFTDKLPEKIYFTRHEIDPQMRSENALTTEILQKLNQKDSSRISESIRSSEIEAEIISFTRQPEILQDDTINRIRKSVEDQRVIAPKKPLRKADEVHENLEASRRSLTDSTMYQSFFEFNRLHTPKVDKDVIYERTSTLKKRMKAPEDRELKKSVKGLFEIPKPAMDINEFNNMFDKMNQELNDIVQDYNKTDFMDEIVQELNDRQKKGKDDVGLTSFLNRGMASNLHDQSRSFEELPNKHEVPVIKRCESDTVGDSSAYQFAVGAYSLPKTPIARQNKIRRNAWLSDSKKPSGGRVSDFGAKLSKSGGDLKVSNNSPDISQPGNRKQYNVSIKFHRNDLDGTSKSSKSNNVSQSDSSINIRLFPSADGSHKSPLVKVNNIDLNNSRYNADINKKYYPMMPEMLSDVIQNKRDRSGFLGVSQCDGDGDREHFVRSLWDRETDKSKKESQVEEENIIVPVRTSVREAVKFIETNFSNEGQGLASPSLLRQSSAPRDEIFFTPRPLSVSQAHEETQTEMFFTPTAEFPKTSPDDVSECLVQASESIQRLNEIFQSNTPQAPPVVVINKRLDSVVNPTPKKITTKVTVNLKKISRRASDVEHLKQKQEQNRHSICNNAELIKRIQMHFKTKDANFKPEKKNDSISASCSSLVPRDSTVDIASPPGKCQKYFCRNCGFTMLPIEMLKKVQSCGRISISSSLAEGLHSIEGSQSMAALRRCLPISETRSTEDLYIDDDFCQGIHQSLAANMELLPPPDFFESFDFNFMTAEIFHTQEQEFDYTLTGTDKNALDWHDEEMNDEVFEANKDAEVEICEVDTNEAEIGITNEVEAENEAKEDEEATQEIMKEPKAEMISEA